MYSLIYLLITSLFLTFLVLTIGIFATVHYIISSPKRGLLYILNKSKRSLEFRNEVLHYMYFFQHLGPGISAYSFPALIDTDSSYFKLTLIFILGIISYRLARLSIKNFCELTHHNKARGVQNV